MNRNTPLKLWLLFVLSVLGSALLNPSLAAGSKDLNGSGPTDYRAYLETGYNGGQTSGVPRKTLLYAFVNAGENLALGSSGQGLGTASINIKNQSGTTLASFTGTGCGVISTRAQEVAGPAVITAGGYPGCTYTPTSSGIYQIEFIAPNNASNGNPIPNLTTTQWTAAAGDSTIAAWDVTVYAGTTVQFGRVYANYFSLNTGTNGKFIKLQAYILTRDGYLYAVTQNLDPYGYIFFANNKGVTDTSGNRTYASTAIANTAATFHSPNSADTANDYTAKVFLFPPSASLPVSSGGEWLRPTGPTLAPTPTNLTFTGRDGTNGYAGSSNGYLTGGTFTFTNPGSSTFPYRLTIPLSSNGTNTDRVLFGTATSGTNSVNWDGLDGSATPQPVSAGNTNYAAFVKLYGGEVHFPLLDVENSNGLVIQRVPLSGQGTLPSTTGADSDPYQVYWDDRTLPKIGGPTNPIEALNGVSSAGPAHVWGDTTSAGFGNNNTVDTWSFYPSSPAANGSGLTVRSADIQIVKTAVSTGAPRGHATQYTLDVSNLSITPGPIQVTVTDPLPAWGTAMTWTCATGCSATSGITSLSTVVSLNGNVAVRINVTITTSNTQTAGAVVTNTGTTSRANDATDPVTTNNTSSVNLTVRDPVAGVRIVKDQRNVTQSGTFSTASMSVNPADAVQYRLTYTATGDTSFTTFTVRDSLPSQLAPAGNATLTCPNGTTATVAPAGQVYSVNAVTPCGTIQPGGTGTLIIPATVR